MTPRDELLPKSSRFLALASVCIVVAALYLGREVLVPVAMAVLVTFLLAPVVYRVERMHVPRVLAVLLVVLLTFAAIGSLGWLISDQVTDLATKVTSYEGQIKNQIASVQSRLGRGALAKASQEIRNMARDVVTSQPDDLNGAARGTPGNPVAVSVQSSLTSSQGAWEELGTALNVISPLAQVLVIIVFVIFMLVQREDLRDRLIRLVGHGQLTVTTQALDEAASRVSKYLLAQSIVNGSIGIVLGFGLFLLGVPNAPLWGLLCALLRFIPYVGIWIGAVFPILLSLVDHPGHSNAWPLLTIGLFVVIELSAGNFVEPLLYGTSTGVSSIAILVAAVFWTWLWGGVGLLLSTPLTVILAVMGKYVPQMEFLNVLLGDQPVLQPFERYYQRLLAEDSEEAEDLLDDFEKTRTPHQLYSEILMPALQLVDKDYRRGVLDDKHLAFIRQEMQEHLETRRQRAGAERQRAGQEREEGEKSGKDKSPGEKLTASHPAAQADAKSSAATRPFSIPSGCDVNVLCLPAHDQSDEIAARMLVQLLEERGYCAQFLSTDALASEMVESVERIHADVVVISALPPAAIAHSRYLCKRLIVRFPDLPMVVGLWGARSDPKKLKERISIAPKVHLTLTFEDALETIQQLAQPLIIRGDTEGKPAIAPPPPVSVGAQ